MRLCACPPAHPVPVGFRVTACDTAACSEEVLRPHGVDEARCARARPELVGAFARLCEALYGLQREEKRSAQITTQLSLWRDERRKRGSR